MANETEREGYRWRRADESIELKNCPDHKKSIVYARIYTSGQDYSYSRTNQHIKNLKHSPNSSEGMLYWKHNAIQRFATELVELFTGLHRRSYALVPIPPSKTRTHPEFDDRLELVATRVAARCGNIICFPVLESTRDMNPYHMGGETRSAEQCYADMKIARTERQRYGNSIDRVLVVLDDVITSGAHYEAARRHLEREFPHAQIAGVFWARTEQLDKKS